MSERVIRIRVAVALTEGSRILLVQHEKRGVRYWLLPGGGVDVGETLVAAAAREMQEETGYAVQVGRLFLICESIEPHGRHIVNLFFAGSRTGGELALGTDRSLRDACWHERAEIDDLPMFPPVTRDLLACWDEDFDGPLRILGDVWQPLPQQPQPPS